MITCYIGLGSNLEDPIQQVKTAIAELQTLPQSEFLAVSSLYQNPPLGPQDQPDFINAVASIKTELTALTLLQELKALEKKHERVRTNRWGSPRTLDLDFLLYGDAMITAAELAVPHPGMEQRAFVLYPLAEIAPDLKLPSGLLLQDLLKQVPNNLTKL